MYCNYRLENLQVGASIDGQSRKVCQDRDALSSTGLILGTSIYVLHLYYRPVTSSPCGAAGIHIKPLIDQASDDPSILSRRTVLSGGAWPRARTRAWPFVEVQPRHALQQALRNVLVLLNGRRRGVLLDVDVAISCSGAVVLGLSHPPGWRGGGFCGQGRRLRARCLLLPQLLGLGLELRRSRPKGS